MDYTFTEYDFTGKVTHTKTIHNAGEENQVIVRNTMSYDHAGRLLDTKQKNDADAEIILVRNAYNEIAQLQKEKVHSANAGANFLQTVDKKYNERGCLPTEARRNGGRRWGSPPSMTPP